MDPLPPNDNTDLLTAMMAGATAGAVQSVATYPFEYLKTSTQIQDNALMLAKPVSPLTLRPLYTGCTALAVGNALKAGTRMCLFNSFSSFMAAENGTTTAPRIVVAGMMTGFVETLWVIPFENIKTRLIENSLYKSGMKIKMDVMTDRFRRGGNSPLKTNKRASTTLAHSLEKKPISHSRLQALKYFHEHPSTTFTGAIKEIYQTQGFRGFKQGSSITILRQCLNSMVWYSTFSSLQQLLDPNRDSTSEFGLFGMGFVSSLAVVATTQPLDLLKTRMQTKNYRLLYRDVMNCAYRIFMKEGLRKFWCGWFPRLIKISVSSTLTLDCYEMSVKGINKLKTMRPFAAE